VRALAAGLLVALTAAACGEPPGVAEEAHVDFTVWSYGVETIQDNIERFEEANPEVTVTVEDHSWFDYPDIMVTKFTGDNPPDVAYSSDHWLEQWVAAGWIAPIDEHCSGVTDYVDDWAPYAAQGMVLDGDLYGLPYYADTLLFMYNDAVVREAGFDGPPQTWEELTEQAVAIKEQGLADHPVNIPLKRDDPWLIETFYSMVYADGGSMFDEDHNPLFDQPGSEAEQVLQWLHDAMHETEILDPAALEVAEPDVVKTMGEGQHIYTVLAKYNLAELNLGAHDQAGNFRMALMPGSEQATVGFVRFYALSSAAAEAGGERLEAACDFLHYFGGETDGEYRVVKRWALEHGLGFANLPLYDDPEVAQALEEWGDVELERQQAELARVKEGLTPYWATWDVFAREQIHEAVLGRASAEEATERMADRWQSLQEEFDD
jgi:multiple sugar transport system substrate-binding protein